MASLLGSKVQTENHVSVYGFKFSSSRNLHTAKVLYWHDMAHCTDLKSSRAEQMPAPPLLHFNRRKIHQFLSGPRTEVTVQGRGALSTGLTNVRGMDVGIHLRSPSYIAFFSHTDTL